jgi:hypothetical protein
MTNGELVRKYESLSRQHLKLADKLIALGLGRLTPTDMRNPLRLDTCPVCAKYIFIQDQISAISSEAKARYGPDLTFVRQLLYMKRTKSIRA